MANAMFTGDRFIRVTDCSIRLAEFCKLFCTRLVLEMRTLWLYAFLVKLCILSRVLPHDSGNSCNVSFAGQVSVPELCLSTQEAAVRLLSGVLNFTLAENGSLVFKPLPPSRQVFVEVKSGSNGLKAWANLANSFVDSVRSGGLPYGMCCTNV